MYTKSDIVFESQYWADVAKAETMADMILENCNELSGYDDATVVLESSNKAIETLKKFIDTLIRKLSEYFEKISKELKYATGSKRIKSVLGADVKAKLDAARKAGKTVKVPDIDKLKAYIDETDKWAEKYADDITKECESIQKSLRRAQTKYDYDYKKNVKNYDNDPDRTSNKINQDTIKLSMEEDKLYHQIDDLNVSIQKQIMDRNRKYEELLKNDVDMPVDKIYDMALKYESYDEDIKRCNDKYEKIMQHLQDTISMFDATYFESESNFDFDSIMREIYYESDSDNGGSQPAILTKAASILRACASTVNNLAHTIAHMLSGFAKEVESLVDRIIAIVKSTESDDK